MESNMRKIMEKSWREWHGDCGNDDVPSVSLAYSKGFDDCHDIMMPLLAESATHVFASHGAEHMLDGFRPQRRQIDDLVDRIKSVIQE